MADAGKVLFHLTDDALIVANSGAPFTREGVIAVCHMHLGKGVSKPPDDYDKNNLIGGIKESVIGVYQNDPYLTAEHAEGEKGLRGDYNGRSVLELLQNADDAATVAALGVKGASGGQIGAKGLGFKSILEFSESPEIYSGEFRFRFSRDDTQKILSRAKIQVGDNAPIFRIPHPRRPDEKCLSLLDGGYATVIRLPFTGDNAEKAEKRLNELNASCLLFCQRLSRIEIEIRGESRVIEIDRGDIFGFENRKATFTLKDGNKIRKWRRWSAAWTPEDNSAEAKKLSAALCLPIEEGEEIAMDKESPVHVFFPTASDVFVPGLRALIHASYELLSNREHFNNVQPHGEEIRKKISELTEKILKDIPASAALRAFGEISAAKGNAATDEIKQLQNVFSGAVAQTPFVPVIGGGKVKPAEARIWRHRLGKVLCENNHEVREAKLLDPSLSAESDVRILEKLGAERVSPHEHAKFLRSCRNDTLTKCHAAWQVAEDIMSEVSKIPSEQKKVVIDALKDAPIWWTDAGTPRSLNGDIPLLQERPKPKNWPDWLKADALSPEFWKLLTDKARHKTDNPLTRHDSLKDAAVWPLTPHSYFTGALLSFCEGKNSEWWEKMGWDVLQWAIRWGGNKTGESIIHLPTDKGWLPAIQCYAGKDWDGPASFDKYFQSVPDRGLLLPMKEWKLSRGAESDKNKWGEFLHGLGVSWTPKVCPCNLAQLGKNSPPLLLEKYTEECLQKAKSVHSSAYAITECEGDAIEHFPGSLTGCNAAKILRTVKNIRQIAEKRIRAQYQYTHQGYSQSGQWPVDSFASFQLRQSEWVPCIPGLSDYVGKRKAAVVRPGDAFMPECGLRGVVPVVKKPDAFSPDEWGAVYGVLKELGVRTNVPASEDKEWWRSQMSKLAEIAKGLGEENEELRHGRDNHGGMSIVILRLYGAYGDSLANMGDVPHLVKTDNGEFIHFGPFNDVYWADMHYHEDADVRRNLLDKGFKLFPFFLRKGERFGVKPLSGFIDESPEENESQRETEEIRRRFERRREMLALATGKPKNHFNFGDKIRGNSALALILTRKDDGIEIARPEVDFYKVGEDKLLINAGGNKWRAFAAGVAAWCKLPEKAPVFEGLLCEDEDKAGDDECRKRLRQLGISDGELNSVSGGEEQDEDNDDSPVSSSPDADNNVSEKEEHVPANDDGEGRRGNSGRKTGNGQKGPGTGGGDPVTRKQVESAAMDAVEAYYRDKGYKVDDVADDNVGWDLEVFLRDEENPLLVEVKGTRKDTINVGLTPNEYGKSGNEMYRLAVVRNALNNPSCAIYKREGKQWRWQEDGDANAPKKLITEEKTGATVREDKKR